MKKEEVWAGVTTFATVSYVLAVTPAILAGGTGMPPQGVMTATVVTGFLLTLAMGLYAKLPVCVVPGMGLNTLFAVTMVQHDGMSWQAALGLCAVAGALLLVLALTPLRHELIGGVPDTMQRAAVVGIGLFITLIGLRNTGIVIADPARLLRLELTTPSTLLGCLGFVLMVAGHARGKPYAIVVGILVVTLLANLLGISAPDPRFFELPDFAAFLALDIGGAFTHHALPALFTLLIIILFDTIPVLNTLLDAAEVPASAREERMVRGLAVITGGTAVAALCGTSPVIPAVENVVGIKAGGRSGSSAVVTALCFLPFLFLGPAVALIPPFATGPALMIVGYLMFTQARELRFDAGAKELVPAFVTMAGMPLTASIAHGLMLGFATFLVVNPLVGGYDKRNRTTYLFGVISVAMLLVEQWGAA